MDVCQFLYVLDFGRLIFSGTPAETRASDLVRRAYLGEIDVVETNA
jgi:ABC-type branched-subunit amino acid transport system ATPase component